jgi:hypothetical protein
MRAACVPSSRRRDTKSSAANYIVAGGGAPLHKATQNPKQNPYSEVVISEYHYALVEASLNEFSLTVHNAAGEIIDEITISKTGNSGRPVQC